MSGAPFWLLIGGAWVQLDGIDSGIQVAMSRPSSESVSLGGVRRAQRARRAPRTWQFAMSDDLDQAPRWLQLAASGLAGDVYLLDQAAAQINMLDPLDTIGRDVAQPTIVVNGMALRTFAASYTLTMRVRAGVTYYLSYVTSQTAAATLGTYSLGAGAVNIVAPAGTGARPGSTSFTPVADGTVTIIITVAGKTSGLRLTEGSVDALGFIPGQKAVCQVSVQDPETTLTWVFADRLPLSGHSITLREIGT